MDIIARIMSDHEYLVVAAIDFGTTFSGYGFSFREKPEDILVNKNWGTGFQSYKTPTSVLVDDDAQFVAMGYEAENMYQERTLLCLEDKQLSPYHLFRHFKMCLLDSQELTLDSEIKAVDQTGCPAKIIFAYAIRYLKDHLLKTVQSETKMKLDPSQVYWVITVPAIWSEPSKKFMKEAARLAGCIKDINCSNVILALEPEAASLCCRRLQIANYEGTQGVAFPEGTKYLILDCGGGTIDVTAHKVQAYGKISEILPADGGPWGGTTVDQRFCKLLEELFGEEFVKLLKINHPAEWLNLCSRFESVKKTFQLHGSRDTRIAIPFTIFETYQSFSGQDIKTAVSKHGDPMVSFKIGHLVLKPQCMTRFIHPSVEKIVELAREKLSRPEMSGCSYIFMVGGFSEAEYLQAMIRNEFEASHSLRVLIPTDAQLAIIKGAVLFGSFTEEIIARIARRTYGYDTFDVFNPKIHSVANKEGNAVFNIFEVLVKKGDSVQLGHEIERITYPLEENQTTVEKDIFAIDGQPKQPVQYTNGIGVENIGSLVADFPELATYNGQQCRFKIMIKFGSTEMTVRVVHTLTGDEVGTKLDFLSG